MVSTNTPFIVSNDGTAESLIRLSFGEGFSEAWLQQQLFAHPECLPFGEANPGYKHVVPLCMEMNTQAGPVDIVYVTPEGKLVVVETKLWRNPEARRKVVGQILDYAKELQSWSYSDLQREVTRRVKGTGNVPFQLVQSAWPDTEETEFVDGVANSLQQGDFLLVIAGDGIRSDTRGIVDYLDNTARMRFTLALVETAVYQTTDNTLTFIQPRTLFRTKEVERVVYASEAATLKPIGASSPENTDTPLGVLYKSFWQNFISQLQLDDPDQPLANPVAKGNVFFPLPSGSTRAWLTVYFYKAQNIVGGFMRIEKSEEGESLYQRLKEMADDIESEISFAVQWDDDDLKLKSSRKFEGNWPPIHDPKLVPYLNQLTNDYINALRPRLERITLELNQ